jgi:hypothetical protein
VGVLLHWRYAELTSSAAKFIVPMKVKRGAESLSKNVMPSTFTYSLTLLLSVSFLSLPLSSLFLVDFLSSYRIRGSRSAVVMKSTLFWDIWVATCFHTILLLGLFFYPEDGGGIYFRNVV